MVGEPPQDPTSWCLAVVALSRHRERDVVDLALAVPVEPAGHLPVELLLGHPVQDPPGGLGVRPAEVAWVRRRQPRAEAARVRHPTLHSDVGHSELS